MTAYAPNKFPVQLKYALRLSQSHSSALSAGHLKPALVPTDLHSQNKPQPTLDIDASLLAHGIDERLSEQLACSGDHGRSFDLASEDGSLCCDGSVLNSVPTSTSPGIPVIPNDGGLPLSRDAAGILEWIEKATAADWDRSQLDIARDMYARRFSGKITEEECEELEKLIVLKNKKVGLPTDARNLVVVQPESARIRFSRARARLSGNPPSNASSQKIVTEEQRLERQERKGRRHYLAKVSVMPAEILREGQYSIGIQAVLARIVHEVMNTGHCEKAVALLAKESGTSERTVQMAVRRAEEAGLINVQARLRKPNRITIIDRRWLGWIKTSINEKSQKEDNYGVSFKGAKSCTPSSDDPDQSAEIDARGAGGPGFSRECVSRSTQSGQGAVAAPSRSDRRTTNRFEELLADLERSVLAQGAGSRPRDANGVGDPEELCGVVPLNGSPTPHLGDPASSISKDYGGSPG